MIESPEAYGHFPSSETQVFRIMGEGCVCEPGWTLSSSQAFPPLFWPRTWSKREGRSWKEKLYFRNFCPAPHPLGPQISSSNNFGNCPQAFVSWCPLHPSCSQTYLSQEWNLLLSVVCIWWCCLVLVPNSLISLTQHPTLLVLFRKWYSYWIS